MGFYIIEIWEFFLYILDIYSHTWFANIFFPNCGLHFNFLKTVFGRAEVINFGSEIYLFVILYILYIMLLVSYLRNKLPNLISQRFSPLLSSGYISFRIMISPLQIFTYGVRNGISYFCIWVPKIFSTICWKHYLFPQNDLCNSAKTQLTIHVQVCFWTLFCSILIKLS